MKFLSISSYFLIIACLVMNTVLSYKDPGFESVIRQNIDSNFVGPGARNSTDQQIDKDENFLNLLTKFDATTLCFECELVRSERSRHCF